MPAAPLVTIVVTNVNQASTLSATLDSIFSQEEDALECFVVDTSAQDNALEILRFFEPRGLHWERVGWDAQTEAMNRAFANARGEFFWWLSGADKLCPWATRLTTFVFQNLPQVEWLTSGTPLTWTPHQLAVSAGLADGYTARAFYAGRNLKTSAYFQFPIWRSGTVWRRSLWEKSGARIREALSEAGDFELWARFFQHANLHTLNIPIAGHQADALQLDTNAYWRAAAQHLAQYKKTTAPPTWVRRAHGQLARRLPSLRTRLMQGAPLVWISPPTLECGIGTHFIL